MSVPWYLMAKGKSGGGYKTASGPIVSVSNALAAPLRSLLVNIEPVQEGSGDPSPDNVRPISGWSAVNVWRTGANVWDEETAARSFLSCYNVSGVSQNRVGCVIDVPAGTYTVATYPKTAGDAYIYMNVVSADGQFVRFEYLSTGGDANRSYTITLTEGQKIYIFDQQATSESSIDKLSMRYIQVAVGVNVTDYHAYTGTTIPVTFPTEAGTVYGGTVDVVRGVLTVDRAMASLAGARLYRDNGTFKIWMLTDQPRSVNSYGGRAICNITKNFGNVSSTGLETKIQFPQTVAGILFASIPADFDIADVQACYELATPITIPLTPTEISTLQGENNVWADSGDVTLEYLASGGANADLMKLAVAFMGRK